MNPPKPWKEIEQTLSDRPLRRDDFPSWANGGDSPAWSRKRESFEPDQPIAPVPGATPYAELHCHSSFSFLDGASDPEDLVEEAARLGLSALAVTDHDGFYAVPRFAQAARAVGLPTVFGAELTLGHARPPKAGALPEPDPHGSHLLVLARDPIGYAALARVISESQLAGEKTAPNMVFADITTWLQPGEAQHLIALTGCRKGMVPSALEAHGPAAADREMAELVNVFGSTNVFAELWDHGSPLDSVRNDALVQLADRRNIGILATNNVHYATPGKHRLAAAMAAVRARSSLDDIVGWLPPSAGAHLRSGAEQARRFARYPGAVELAAQVGLECAFDLALVAPSLPPYPTPDGMDEMAFLRHLVEEAGVHRYGTREGEFVPGAWKQLDHELDLIDHLGFAGYFLVVWDIVEFCHRSDILCQGRGSAANSAVCYVLGITKADAVSLGLLFERFLAPERDGPPDIDLDIESDRREEAIQYVYATHGRRHAAQVANVITYRSRSAVRDAAKALGYAPGQQDAFSKSIDRWSGLGNQQAKVDSRKKPSHGYSNGPAPEPTQERGTSGGELPDDVLELALEFKDLPRHLGIHSGGMVMCDRPVIEVCPVEWGRMKDRTVLQWDKEDCAIAGLVKFDLLGLGMLSALHYSMDLIEEHHGTRIDLAALPQEDEVYQMLCRADSVGVFQVESRAQMSTLPRLKPRNFYDLVVEIALIRPGPIQGGSVHPYIRRRNGQEPVTYLHPLLKPALEKTLGIPLFQEQLMQMAIDVSGFTPSEADELRRAMGSKRSVRRMEQLQERLYAGMTERDVEPDIQEQIWIKLVAFANYGFPESHSISFAYLVYASSWIKLHYPAAFCAALLNAQPMGFYSPHSLVQDARRHGVPTLSPDVNASGADAGLVGQVPYVPNASEETAPPDYTTELGLATWPDQFDHGWAVRLGIGSVRGIGEDMAETIAINRPYTSIEQMVRKTGVSKEQVEAMATAGCFDTFGSNRRQALWTAGAVAEANRPNTLPGIVTGIHAPQLPGMGDQEEALADLWATGVAPDGHPTLFLRPDLDRMGALRATELAAAEHGSKVMIGGVVTHRQRPATASGVTFLGLEDETGLMNVVVSVGCWARFRRVARNNPALIIRGRLERTETGDTPVINIVAERLDPLKIGAGSMSRDFR